MPETIVIALGGNAITRPGERGTIPQQFEHTRESLELLLPVLLAVLSTREEATSPGARST